MNRFRRLLLSALVVGSCALCFGQRNYFTKQELESSPAWGAVFGGASEPYLYYKFRNDSLFTWYYIGPLYSGCGPYYLSDTPDTVYMPSKFRVKTKGRYVIALVHPEAKSLFRFQYSSPQFTAIRIQHSIGLLFPPQPAVLYPWSDLFLEE